MKKPFYLVIPVCIVLAVCSDFVCAGEDKATPEDVIKKVYEASQFLTHSDESALESFNERNGPWVFKDTYVFVFECAKGTIVAHPIKASLIGRSLLGLKDIKGNFFFAQLCVVSKKDAGGWVEYWWPKVDGQQPERKVTFMIQVPGTNYQVGAGIYDESKSVEDLEKLLIIKNGEKEKKQQ